MRRPRASRSADRRREEGDPDSSVTAEIAGLGLILLGLVGALALGSYHPTDPLFELAPVENRAGLLGAHLAGLLHAAVGWGAVVVVTGIGLWGVRLLLGRGWTPVGTRTWVGTLLTVLALATLPPIVHELWPGRIAVPDGGAVGDWLAAAERSLLNPWGALLVSGLLLVVGLLSLFGVSSGSALVALGRAAGVVAIGVGRGLSLVRLGIRSFATYARARASDALDAAARGIDGLRRKFGEGWSWRWRRARHTRPARPIGSTDAVGVSGAPAEIPVPVDRDDDLGARAPSAARRSGKVSLEIVDHEAERRAREPAQEMFAFRPEDAGPYQPPDVSIFQRPPEGSRRIDPDSLTMNARILEKKLADFGVMGSVLKVHPGPVITMYEFEPASGVKVGKIVGLSDDLALALRALSVRIIAPLPGKSVVGIEVSNPTRETVYLRENLESEAFRKAAGRLTLALGKDIFGNPVEANLARMPHLLVAGATGTGKSVFLNSLLCSLLFRATPSELKLLLIDPKLLELSIYEGIPHLIVDVVTNPKKAASALAGIVHKMTERYQMMAALGVRSIDQFNERVDEELAQGQTTFRLKKKPGEEEGREVEYARLPYIVVVVDELADLMVVAARDVEESLQRLAQMARAAGILLVLATQRPSVDVLTGVIKANFPARISFQVSSRTDSRTILDQNGAEHLLGMGDMLFLPPGTSKLQRIHGAFVDEKEAAALAGHLREQGRPEYDESLLEAKTERAAKEEADEEGADELYDRGVAIVTETRNASISYLQRRLKVGYNRAARMIERMEEEGVVGPNEGSKGREVLASPLPIE